MGRGGYRGGSTIVGRFGWSTFDPASNGGTPQKPKSQAARSPSASAGKDQLASPSANKKARKAKRPPNLNLLRLTYLEAIIDAALRARPAPVPPKLARDQLKAATLSAGGPVEWAKAQREYAALLERKQRKLAREAQPLGGDRRKAIEREARLARQPTDARETVRANRARSVEALCRERARLSTLLTAAEAEVISHRKAIVELDRLIAAADSARR